MQDAIVIGDRQSQLIAKMMELSQRRQQVISHNLANANTPGYTRQDVNFGTQLQQALRAESTTDFDAIRPQVVEDHESPARLDGNNVEVPSEMGEMMQNGLTYQLLVKAFNTRTSILRMAMQGAN